MALPGAATPRPAGSPRSALHALIVAAALFISLLPVFPHARAQTDATPPDELIRVNTDLVTIPVIVTDRRDRRVAGLTAGHFEVRDEGRGVEVSYFAAGAERVALLFLLDASGSTRDIIDGQREAALALFSRFGKRSRVAVIHFQETAETSLAFTSDADAARAAFRFVALRGRRTAIFDAALAALRAFAAPGADESERRIVILISDGLDTASRVRPSAVIDAARASNVAFYVIHTRLFWIQNGRLVPRSPAKGFRDLAQKTGGQLFAVGDAETSPGANPQYDFRHVFSAIEDDLRGQYVLGYYAGAAERAGGPRRIEVRLKPRDAGKFRVRALRDAYVLNRQTDGGASPTGAPPVP